jgi:hypothetical protein
MNEVEEWEDTSRTVWTWKRHDEHHHGRGYILVESEDVQGGLLCPVCQGVVLTAAPFTPES